MFGSTCVRVHTHTHTHTLMENAQYNLSFCQLFLLGLLERSKVQTTLHKMNSTKRWLVLYYFSFPPPPPSFSDVLNNAGLFLLLLNEAERWNVQIKRLHVDQLVCWNCHKVSQRHWSWKAEFCIVTACQHLRLQLSDTWHIVPVNNKPPK